VRRLLAATACLAAVAAGAWLLWPRGPILVVEDPKSGRVLLSERVRPGERFTLSYLHSVSKTRVRGVFEVAPDGALVVRETSFGTPGPGLPEPTGGDRVEIAGGAIRVFDLDQRLPELSFFVHPYTEHAVEIGGRTLALSAALPPATIVKIRTR
jgi:hypothetical protein